MFAEPRWMGSLLAVHSSTLFVSLLPFLLLATLLLALIYVLYAARNRRPSPRSNWNYWEQLLYLVLLVSVTILAITSFYPVLRHEAMKGWSLFIHMVGAGVFVFLLPVLAVTWCEASRFQLGSDTPETSDPAPRFYWIPKSLFWLLLASGLVVSLTMLFSMTELFGTEGLELLLEIHRYSGLIVVATVLLHLSSIVLQRLGWR